MNKKCEIIASLKPFKINHVSASFDMFMIYAEVCHLISRSNAHDVKIPKYINEVLLLF